jgi:hypothetical protein
MTEQNRPTTQRIIVTSTKSVGISLILTFLFGSLGMLYSTIWGAIIMTIVSIIVGTITLGMGLFLVWPICMIWAAMAAASYNKKLFEQLEK